jgi:pimeloyl-ACP methyl ester carboxylesterase
MKVESRTTAEHDDTHASPKPKSVPVTRVLAGSLIAGAVIALVLTLVVFPGATEAVITGSIILAFGLGWAMITVLSTRLTSQPQRWAAVPAAAMTVTGLGLITFSPGNAALTCATWVWPAALFALVVWMFVSMRRALAGRGRWLLTPVLMVLAIASIGATAENVLLLRDQGTYRAAGASYEVSGHRLHLDCRGQGGPTVVLFNGLGEISTSWALITDQVSTTTRICAYDRAGQGWSQDVANPQDGITAARDLHLLLAEAGEAGPYVLVGHSIGGPYALTYAAQYPKQVAGMVLLDSSSPEQLTSIPSYAGQYAMMRRGLALLPTFARLGLSRVFAASHLPGEEGDQVRAMTSTPHALRNGRDEVSTIPEMFEQAQALTTLNGRPLAVLTATETLDTSGWAAAQDKLAALSANHLHRDVDSTHAGLVEDQGGSTASGHAITEVVTAVHTGSPLATP